MEGKKRTKGVAKKVGGTKKENADSGNNIEGFMIIGLGRREPKSELTP